MTKRKQTHWVSIPITGRINIAVSADDDESAVEAAWDVYNEGKWDPDDVEWEATESVTEGNVCHAMQNDIEVSRVKS
jgi:hypothetical protein